MKRTLKFPHVFRTKTIPASRIRCDEAQTMKIRSIVEPGSLRPGEEVTHTFVLVNRHSRATEAKIVTSCVEGLLDYSGLVPWHEGPIVVSPSQAKTPSALVQVSDEAPPQLPPTAYVDVKITTRFCDPMSRFDGPFRFSHKLHLDAP